MDNNLITRPWPPLKRTGTTITQRTAGDILDLTSFEKFSVGKAVVATDYWVGRDADGTNQMHFNVPTGASYEWSINDTSTMSVSAAGALTVTSLVTPYLRTLSVAKSGGDYTTIQAAIDYAVTQTPSATNLWTVEIYPGVYTEAISMASFVNLKGMGTKSSVVIYQSGANVVKLATNSQIQNLTVRTGATGADLRCFYDNGVACTTQIIDVNLESTETTGTGWTGLYVTGAGNYTLDRCYTYNTATAGGTGDQGVVLIEGVAATVNITNGNFHMEGAPGITSSKSILGVIAPAACTINSSGNRYSGDAFCNMIYGEDGTIISNNDSILTPYADQISSPCVVEIDNGIRFSGITTINATTIAYVPAYLTGGNAATADFNTWASVTDGSFAITINGVARTISGIDFTGVLSMADVAGKIQTAIRVATSALETCAWSVNHFVFSSVNATSISAITVTSATGAGTDISGAGGTTYMDAEVAVGIVTDKVAIATYDLIPSDYIIAVDYTVTGALTSLTLPTAQCVSGRTIIVKDSGGGSGANTITIDTEGGEKIDGSDTKILNSNYSSTKLYSNGNNWFTF